MRRLLLSICLFGGIGCAAYSVFVPWFEVPTSSSSLHGATSMVATSGSRCDVVFRLIAIIATSLSVAIYYCRPQSRRVATVAAAAGLAALLFFPHIQQTWQPQLTARAAWLQIQHENLTWFGGDIFRGQELEGSPAQMQMYLSDSPRHVTVMKLPTWSLHTFGLNQLPSCWNGSGTPTRFVSLWREDGCWP